MDKCIDKNAKFFFKLTMTQIMELGTNKRGSQYNKEVLKTESSRENTKNLCFSETPESFGEYEARINEESKMDQNQLKGDQLDELYSYYTGSSPASPERLRNLEEETNQLKPCPISIANLNLILTTPELNNIGVQSPQTIANEHQNLISTTLRQSKKQKSLLDDSLIPLAQNSEGSTNVFKEEYEKLKRAYSILEKDYREMENRNDFLSKKIEDLNKTNLDYLNKIQEHIESKNKLTLVELYDTNQFEKTISRLIIRLKQQPGYDTENVEECQRVMMEMAQKITENKNTMLRKDELQKLEREKDEKQIQMLRQHIQQLLKENEQYHQKQQPRGNGCSFDNTGLFASFKTREESIIEENEEISKLNSSDVAADRQQDMCSVLDKSTIIESVRASSNQEISALKQEINQLNSKLSVTDNLQKKYEEEIQKKSLVEQEVRTLKKELEKAQRGWSYAEEERYDLANKVKEYEDGSRIDQKVDMLEMQLFKLKTKLGEVMNVTLEFGRADMLDRIESIMGADELSNIRASMNKQSFWD